MGCHKDDLIKKLTHAVEQSTHTVVITDPNGVIEYVNPCFERLTGFSKDEAVGKNPSISKSGKTLPEVYREIWETIKSGKDWRGEILNKKKSGELYWASLAISPIKDESGQIVNYLAIEEDISTRKAVAQKLEETLASLTRTNKELDQFTSMVSHDLQGPLSTICNALELALSSTADSESSKEMIEVASSCARRAQLLVHDLLQYSRAAGKSLELSQVSLNGVIATAQRNLQYEAERGPTNIVVRELPVLESSELFLVQIFQNLLANALKYNDKDMAEIEIYAVQSDSYWEICVKDNGVGISEDEIERLFEPFFRATSAGRRTGTGLGLATCRKLAERLGGSIGVTSTLGQGSMFIVRLPEARLPESCCDQQQLGEPSEAAPSR